MGDGNLHLNIMTHGPNDELMEILEPWIWEQTKKPLRANRCHFK